MRTLMLSSVAALAMTASGAFADDTLSDILSSDTYAGARVVETRSGPFGYKVEAILPDGSRIENRYRLDGSLRKEEIEANGFETENRYDRSGNLVSSEVEPLDDDDAEDDDDDIDDDEEDERDDDRDDDGDDDHDDDDDDRDDDEDDDDSDDDD